MMEIVIQLERLLVISWGAYLGYSSIDKYYIDHLELKELILELADDLSYSITDLFSNETSNSLWLDKYVTCQKKKHC